MVIPSFARDLSYAERASVINPPTLDSSFPQVRFSSRAASPDLLFTRDGVARFIEAFVVDQSINLIRLSKPFYLAVLMLPNSSHQAVCNAGIENDPTAIGHHVDVECFHQLVRCFALLICHPERSEGPLIGGQCSQTILDHFRFVDRQVTAVNAHSNCEVLRFAQDDIHLLMRLFVVRQRALLKAQQTRLRAKDLFRESRDD